MLHIVRKWCDFLPRNWLCLRKRILIQATQTRIRNRKLIVKINRGLNLQTHAPYVTKIISNRRKKNLAKFNIRHCNECNSFYG